MHSNLAIALVAQGQMAVVLMHYQEAIRLQSNYAEAHNNLGNVL